MATVAETTFEQDVEIDLYQLHEEVKKQPNLYFKWAKKYAAASKENFRTQEELRIIKAEVKSELDVLKAELDSEIRSNYESYGFDRKPTEAAINGWIIQQRKYKKCEEETAKKIKDGFEKVAQALEDEKVMEAAKVSMTHRKDSLSNAISLWLGEYYSDPKVPKEYRDKIESSKSNDSQKDLSSRMKGRRRKK
jgi:predicted transglutaminase-like protease